MNKLVKGSWFFKAETTERKIRDFLQEYIDGKYLILHDIRKCDVLNGDGTYSGESCMVAEFESTPDNLNWFKREFGSYCTIQEVTEWISEL